MPALVAFSLRIGVLFTVQLQLFPPTANQPCAPTAVYLDQSSESAPPHAVRSREGRNERGRSWSQRQSQDDCELPIQRRIPSHSRVTISFWLPRMPRT